MLNKVREEKEKHRAELYTKIKKKMFEFLGLESRAAHLCERLRAVRSIYAQPQLLYLLDSQLLLRNKKFKINKGTNN